MKSIVALFQKIRSLSERSAATKSRFFDSARTTQRWLDSLSNLSEYEQHQALVQGLERFNGDVRGDAIKRLKALRLMEERGLSVQSRIAADYIVVPGTSTPTNHAVWFKAHLFWNQMAMAYLQFLRLSLGGKEKSKLRPWRAEIIFKNLRYTALSMRWESFRGQRPTEISWRRLHRIYRMAEITGSAFNEQEIAGKKTSCVREYTLALLFDLANLHMLHPREIGVVADILESFNTLPIPENGKQCERHSYIVDLAASHGAEKISGHRARGKRARYLEMQVVVGQMESLASSTPDTQAGMLCKQVAKILARAGARRDSARTPVAGEVDVAAGIQAILGTMQAGQSGEVPSERWKLRDESREGLGLIMPQVREMPVGRLLGVRHQTGESCLQLLAVRWRREENGLSLLGAESLSKHPKLVEVDWQTKSGTTQTSPAIFLPLINTSRGVASNLLIPLENYSQGQVVMLRDDAVLYRLSLGQIVEAHDTWLRVEFNLLAREAAAKPQTAQAV